MYHNMTGAGSFFTLLPANQITSDRNIYIYIGIIYSRAGSSINVIINILFDGQNILFDVSLVLYIYIVLIFLQL
jgi:hypothetical protein